MSMSASISLNNTHRPSPSKLSKSLRDQKTQRIHILPSKQFSPFAKRSKCLQHTFPLRRSRITRAFWKEVYLLNALASTSSETSLLRSPTNNRNHATSQFESFSHPALSVNSQGFHSSKVWSSQTLPPPLRKTVVRFPPFANFPPAPPRLSIAAPGTYTLC